MDYIFNFGLLKLVIYLQLVIFIFNQESQKREEFTWIQEKHPLLEDSRNGSTKVPFLCIYWRTLFV